MPWECRENLQVFIMDQHDEKFTVYEWGEFRKDDG
jgi:hypothetical protein